MPIFQVPWPSALVNRLLLSTVIGKFRTQRDDPDTTLRKINSNIFAIPIKNLPVWLSKAVASSALRGSFGAFGHILTTLFVLDLFQFFP